MFLVFYRTIDVFKAEEILNDAKVKTEIVPTPVQDKAYCGICLNIASEDAEKTIECVKTMEYKTIPT